MEFTKLLDNWKSIAGVIILIVSTTVGIISWADEKLEKELLLQEAKQSLIHSEIYQMSRIERKEIEIKENKRELNSLLYRIGDDEPTPREQREIDFLDSEIIRLRKEIEDIRAEISTNE